MSPADSGDTSEPASEMSPVIRVIETDGNVVEFAATTPGGVVSVLAEVSVAGDLLTLRGVHVGGPGARSVGLSQLRVLARLLGIQYGVKSVAIHGATRTSGANPGHLPRPIVIMVGESS